MTDHELNKLLADVVGLRWGYCAETNEYGYFIQSGDHISIIQSGDYISNWSPLTDHNQMAVVEAAMQAQGFDYSLALMSGEFSACIWKRHSSGGPTGQTYKGYHSSKLRAFAVAVAAMKGDAHD